MARRHRRHYRGLVRFPGLGRLPSLSGSVKTQDVLIGAALGLAGSVGLQLGANKLAAGGTNVPAFLTSGSPLVGGGVTAGALYFLERKKNPARAAGHAIGAGLAGLAVWGFGMLQQAVATASPAAAAQAATAGWGFMPRVLPGGMGAPLFMNPRLQAYNGPIFNNPNTQLANYSFARLAAAMGNGDDNEDGNFPAP
jgi:hypothetical protein